MTLVIHMKPTFQLAQTSSENVPPCNKKEDFVYKVHLLVALIMVFGALLQPERGHCRLQQRQAKELLPSSVLIGPIDFGRLFDAEMGSPSKCFGVEQRGDADRSFKDHKFYIAHLNDPECERQPIVLTNGANGHFFQEKATFVLNSISVTDFDGLDSENGKSALKKATLEFVVSPRMPDRVGSTSRWISFRVWVYYDKFGNCDFCSQRRDWYQLTK